MTTDVPLLVRVRNIGMAAVDKVPGLHRFVSELTRVEFFDRSMVIAAQALLGLIPLLIVMVAFLPQQFDDTIVQRFEYATGITPGRILGTTSFSSEAVKDATGWIGLCIALFAATSFAGAVQRMLEHVWALPHIAGVAMRLRGLLWFVIWLTALQLSSLLARVFDLLLSAPVLQLVTQSLTAVMVWWWTLRVLLMGRVPWARLAPTAILIGVLTAVYSITSELWMPRYVLLSVSQFRALGLVLAISTWLIGLSIVITVSAVLGHVYATSPAAAKPLGQRFRRHRRQEQGQGQGQGQGAVP